jgi:hypothetical protein
MWSRAHPLEARHGFKGNSVPSESGVTVASLSISRALRLRTAKTRAGQCSVNYCRLSSPHTLLASSMPYPTRLYPCPWIMGTASASQGLLQGVAWVRRRCGNFQPGILCLRIASPWCSRLELGDQGRDGGQGRDKKPSHHAAHFSVHICMYAS